MKTLIIFCVVLGTTWAVPGGYYKQEYQFKKTSSTYNNNQLESKNDDEGYYGKQGDLDGQVAPQVAQHNQHSEFISPAVDGVGHSLTTYNDRDLTPEAERAFRDHNLKPGVNAHHAYSTFVHQRPVSAAGGASNLAHLTQNLQYDMSQQVREAIQQMHGQSAYATQMRTEDMQYLENQLRSNITRQLQEALRQQNQGYAGAARYDTNEYNNLRQQMETDLMKQLHDGARTAYSTSSSSSSSSSYSYGSGGSSNRQHLHRDSAELDDLNRHGQRVTSYRPQTGYIPMSYSDDDIQRPERISYSQYPVSASHSGYSSSNTRRGYTSYDRDFPALSQTQIVINPQRSVTDVVQDVQNKLNEEVRSALKTYQAKYLSSTYLLTNTRPDFQVALDDFKRDLRYNITRSLQDELQKVYGHQETRGEYSFSQNSRTNANYRVADLEDLKKQVEDNLNNYLETSLKTYESNYQRSRTEYLNSQRDYTVHGPKYTQSLTSDIAQNPNYVRYEQGPYPGGKAYRSQSSYSASSSFSSDGTDNQRLTPQLQQIRDQLQEDLNRQLQAAVYEQKSHSSYNSQSSGSHLEQLLTDELKSNLTRKLSETLTDHYGKQGVRGGQSYTISASGVYYPNANYRTEDLTYLRQKLQDDLVRSLHQQLNQQGQQAGYRSSSSQYSASSSSSSSGGYQGLTTPVVNKPTTDDQRGQHTDDIHDLDWGSLVQKTDDFDEFEDVAKLEFNSKPIRGDIGQITPAKQDNSNETSSSTPKSNVGQQIEDLGHVVNDFDLGQQPIDEDYSQIDILGIMGSHNQAATVALPKSTTQKPSRLNDNMIHRQIPVSSRSTTPKPGNFAGVNAHQQSASQQKHSEDDEFGQQVIDEDYAPVEAFLGSTNTQLHSANHQIQYTTVTSSTMKPTNLNNFEELGQQQIEEDYDQVQTFGSSSNANLQSAGHHIQYGSSTTPRTTSKRSTIVNINDFDLGQQQIDDDYGPVEAVGSLNGANLQSASHQMGRTSTTPRSINTFDFDDLGQQQIEEDYDAFDLGVKPLASSTSTSTSTSTTTEYSTYGVYRNRYSPSRPNSGSYGTYSRPQHSYTSATRPATHDDFIDHGDYLQHKPQPHSYDLESMDFTQQVEDPGFEAFLAQGNNPEDDRAPAVSLTDLNNAYTRQQQYANAPRGVITPTNRESTTQATNRPAYLSNSAPIANQHQDDDDLQQQQVEPFNVYSSYQAPRGRTYTYAAPPKAQSPNAQGENQNDSSEESPKISKKQEDSNDANSSEGVEEIEAVTEVVQPLGFWKRVGGKISSGFNTVKQKTKDLFGAGEDASAT